MKQIEFTIAIKKLSLCYNKDFDEDTIRIWYDYFKDIDIQVFNKCIDKIIKQNKFMPNVSELLKECELQKKQTVYNILELMNKNNYFKTEKEYEKANMWLEKEIIPGWFLNDMKKYYNSYLENKNIKLLGE
jgi:hypothetical protein